MGLQQFLRCWFVSREIDITRHLDIAAAAGALGVLPPQYRGRAERSTAFAGNIDFLCQAIGFRNRKWAATSRTGDLVSDQLITSRKPPAALAGYNNWHEHIRGKNFTAD